MEKASKDHKNEPIRTSRALKTKVLLILQIVKSDQDVCFKPKQYSFLLKIKDINIKNQENYNLNEKRPEKDIRKMGNRGNRKQIMKYLTSALICQ